MRHIQTEIDIEAPPQVVWDLLMDFDNYTNWNPFIKSIQGAKSVGSKLIVTIRSANAEKEMTFRPIIKVLETEKELKWLGKLGISGIFDGEHYFKLEQLPNGHTKFIQGERFSGILVALMGKALDQTQIGFEEMNIALKNASENRQ